MKEKQQEEADDRRFQFPTWKKPCRPIKRETIILTCGIVQLSAHQAMARSLNLYRIGDFHKIVQVIPFEKGAIFGHEPVSKGSAVKPVREQADVTPERRRQGSSPRASIPRATQRCPGLSSFKPPPLFAWVIFTADDTISIHGL